MPTMDIKVGMKLNHRHRRSTNHAIPLPSGSLYSTSPSPPPTLPLSPAALLFAPATSASKRSVVKNPTVSEPPCSLISARRPARVRKKRRLCDCISNDDSDANNVKGLVQSGLTTSPVTASYHTDNSQEHNELGLDIANEFENKRISADDDAHSLSRLWLIPRNRTSARGLRYVRAEVTSLGLSYSNAKGGAADGGGRGTSSWTFTEAVPNMAQLFNSPLSSWLLPSLGGGAITNASLSASNAVEREAKRRRLERHAAKRQQEERSYQSCQNAPLAPRRKRKRQGKDLRKHVLLKNAQQLLDGD